MTFNLPEIKLDSHRVYAILKIAIIVSVFVVVAINVIAAHAYEFVYCTNPINGLTIIYPEGTTCDLNEEVENEEKEDESEDE